MGFVIVLLVVLIFLLFPYLLAVGSYSCFMRHLPILFSYLSW